MKPTPEQVKTEIEKLREMKPRVRQWTAFGDDNRAAIDVQIRVLEKNLTNNQIYDRWDMSDYLLSSALEALYWLAGKVKLPPSKDWSSLIR